MRNLILVSCFLLWFSNGCTNKVEVVPPPRPEFSANVQKIKPGESVSFTNLSKGEIETYSWSFQGAENPFSNQKDPGPVLYKKPGRYLVSLTVSGPNGSNTITKSDFIIVSSINFQVDWLKQDSIKNGYVYFRGKIKGFSPTVFYGGIAFVYSYQDPDPGLSSYGFYIYPDSKGEFTCARNISNGNFYYRIMAWSLDYELFQSEVQRSKLPELSVTNFSVSPGSGGLLVNAIIQNFTPSTQVRILHTIFPENPIISGMSTISNQINHNNGVVSQTVSIINTLKKINTRIYANDFSSGAIGYSPIISTIVPESFEINNFYNANNWTTNSFIRAIEKSRSGLYSLASPSFYGSSGGQSQTCVLDLNLESACQFSFYSAAENLSPGDVLNFYVDNQLKATLYPGLNFSATSVQVGEGNHKFAWTLTKFSSGNYYGRIFLDDLTVTPN